MSPLAKAASRRKINKDRVVACLLFIALVFILSVRLEPAIAEPQLATIPYDCAPAFEMGMPIAEADVIYE